MEKKTIKINFCSFGIRFNIEDNFIINALKKRYDIVISEQPDFLFYSVFDEDSTPYENCIKIFYTDENITPAFNDCDYAIGFDHIQFEDRYLRFPFNAQLLHPGIQDRTSFSDDLAKRMFCNFVYSNSTSGEGTKLRMEFCEQLAKYKHVDCPGRVLNNMSGSILDRDDMNWEAGKIEFLKDYKFTIAFENSSTIGYTTEKMVQPLLANSIPIYWGNPGITREFNPKAFINCNDYNSFEEVIEKIKELDSNDELYMEMLKQPPMQPDYKFDIEEQLENFLYNIIEKGNVPTGRNPRNLYLDYNEKLMRDVVNYKKIKARYNKYRILSAISLGKSREKYKTKLDWYKPKATKLKEMIERLKAIK